MNELRQALDMICNLAVREKEREKGVTCKWPRKSWREAGA